MSNDYWLRGIHVEEMGSRAAVASPPLVMKFGGAALASPRRVRLAARRIAAHVQDGRRVVAVVSAAGCSTDRILEWCARVSGTVPEATREMDRALATGEDRSAALLALSLDSLGVPARSLRGGEAGIQATGDFGEGRMADVSASGLVTLLDHGIVPVVSGFQGTRRDGETVTLGRGASDTTAVALAAALGAECHLIKDVAAIYDRDPKTDPTARPSSSIDHFQLLDLVYAGAGVVRADAVQLAWEMGVMLRIYRYDAPLSGRSGTVVAPRLEVA